MVSTRKKKQSNRRLLSQLDDFDQDMIIGNQQTHHMVTGVGFIGSSSSEIIDVFGVGGEKTVKLHSEKNS